MPELPDVAVFKKYMDGTALHQKIKQTRVHDDYVIKEVTKRTLQRRLSGRSFGSTRRLGKYLFAQLDDGEGWLGLHFGMTGYLRFSSEKDDLPESTRIRFDFSNSKHLAYVCRRKLGEVRVINDLEAFIEEHELGFDALDAVDADTFVERVGGRRGGIKSTLMNQKILSGLGNVYTDEILFQTRIHPETKVSNLSVRDLRGLYDIMRDVLQTAIDAGADRDEMPSHFLLPHREEGKDCPGCSGNIQKIEVNGRSTYICPRCQKK